jgi:hypothetical protein
MTFAGRKAIQGLVTVVLLLPHFSQAGAVRVSFLNDKESLRQSLEILRSSGCTQTAIVGFRRAVERYHANSFEFDVAKFPACRDGFYSFESASGLVAALPGQLCETQHAYELNCFDTVIGLAADRLRTRLQPDEIFGPILVSHTTTNGAFMILPVATARDAFALVYPAWYREVTEGAFPKSMHDARVSLTAALFRWYVLPLSTTEQGLGNDLFQTLRTSWSRLHIRFPRKFEVVLCHEVHFPERRFATSHAGLIFPREKGYTYIEKSGGQGPFVRLDFDERADLLTWLAEMFRADKFGYTHHFATFNDTRIQMLQIAK